MAVVRYIGKEKGLDLKSSDLRRLKQYASDGSNFDYDSDEDLTNRPGYKPHHISNSNGYFISTFRGIDGDKEETTHLIYADGVSLYKIVIESIRVRSLTSNTYYTYEMLYDETQGEYYAQVLNGGTALWSMVLSDSISIQDMVDDFNTTLAGVASMTASGATGSRANYSDAISIGFGQDGTSVRDAYVRYYVSEIITNYTTFDGSFTSKTATALLGDILYVATGNFGLKKYDGLSFYKAGMPKPTTADLSPVAGSGFGGAAAAGTYIWRFQYEFTDNAGNIVTGKISDEYEITLAAGQDLEVTFANFASGYKYETTSLDAAIDITYSAGDTIVLNYTSNNVNVGSRVYWRSYNAAEGLGGNVVESTPQSLQTGIVTVDTGSAVHVKVDRDGRIVSNSWPYLSTISVIIWRTQVGQDGPYYLAGQVPYGPAGSKVWESHSDANLVKQAIFPDDPPDYGSLPPSGRYIAAYRNQLVITGINGEPDNVYFSEPGFQENFPIGSNVFKCTGGDVGDGVTGLGPSEDFLLVTKDRSIFRVTGDLGSSFAVDRIKVGIGCISHYSIQELSQGRMAFLSHKGPWQVFRGQEVLPLGPASAEPDETRIAPFFSEANGNNSSGNGFDAKYKFEFAHGLSVPGQNKYYLNIPIKFQGNKETESVCFVYDFHHDTWSRYDGLQCVGDMASIDTENFDADQSNTIGGQDLVDLPWFFTRLGNGQYPLMRMYRGDYYWQHNDDGQPILMSYATHWEGSESPSQLKKFLRPYVLSIGGEEYDLTVTQQLNWDRTRDASILSLIFTGSETNLKGKFREQRARSQRLVFSSSTINQKVKISGYELEVETPYAGKMKE